MDDLQKQILKYMDKWMGLREQGITITQYCRDRNVKYVGVYGYGRLGRHLVWELEQEGFTISCIIDKRYDMIKPNDETYTLLAPKEINEIKEVDMVIVTAFGDYYPIEAELCKYIRTEVVSIEALLNFV